MGTPVQDLPPPRLGIPTTRSTYRAIRGPRRFQRRISHVEVTAEVSPHLQLARHVTHLSRAIRRRIDPVLHENLGIRGRELFVLRAVETGESNPMRIAERLDIAASSASRTFERLVQLGLLDRADDPDDRRKARLTLTARGRDTAQRARQHVTDALHEAYGGVPRADIEHAVRTLARLVAHAEPDESTPGTGRHEDEAIGAGLHG